MACLGKLDGVQAVRTLYVSPCQDLVEVRGLRPPTAVFVVAGPRPNASNSSFGCILGSIRPRKWWKTATVQVGRAARTVLQTGILVACPHVPGAFDAFENIDASGALKRGFELQDLWRALF